MPSDGKGPSDFCFSLGRVQVHSSLLVTLAWVTLEGPPGAECSLGLCARCPGRFLSHLPHVISQRTGFRALPFPRVPGSVKCLAQS